MEQKGAKAAKDELVPQIARLTARVRPECLPTSPQPIDFLRPPVQRTRIRLREKISETR
jgi:hypothetical protein